MIRLPVQPRTLVPPRSGAARTPNAQRIAAALLGVLVVGVIAAFVSGWWAGGRAAAPPAATPEPTRTATAGPVGLEVGAGWVPVARVPGLDGLPDATAAFTPAASLRAYAIVSVTPAEDPTLLPAALRAIMPAKLPAPKKTELLGLPAWRYGELDVSEGRRLEVTVVPSTGGTLSVACIAPRESWVSALGCAGDVRRLTPAEGVRWLPPAADVAALERIPAVVGRLDAQRVPLRAKLRAAKTRGGQSRSAAGLSGAYGKAALALEDATPGSGRAAAVLAGLRATAVAYGRLGNAAAAGAPRRYKAAKRAAKGSEAKLKAALAALG